MSSDPREKQSFTESEAIEVLRDAGRNAVIALRNCVNARQIGEGYRQIADDLDNAIAEYAIASLSAPKPESAEAVDYNEIASVVQDATGRGVYPSMVEAVLARDIATGIWEPLYIAPPRPEASDPPARKDGRAGIDRLWDSQWVNIVNAPEVLNAESAEDAVNIAVRMTEQTMAANFAKAAPQQASAPAPVAGDAVAMQPVAEIAMSDDGYKIGLLGPLRAHRLPLGTKLYASPEASLAQDRASQAAGPSAPVGVEDREIAEYDQFAAIVNALHGAGESMERAVVLARSVAAALDQQPAAVDDAVVRKVAKAINAELEGDDNIVLAWERLGSNERKLRDRMARAAIAALSGQQQGGGK